jgi:hypothetical protein
MQSLCADSAVAEAITAAQDVLAAKNCGAGSLPQGTATNLATNGRRLMQGGQRHCCTPSCFSHLNLTPCGRSQASVNHQTICATFDPERFCSDVM